MIWEISNWDSSRNSTWKYNLVVKMSNKTRGVIMGKFNFNKTKLEGVYIIEPKIIWDERGYFIEIYNKKQFSEAGLNMTFVQDNESKSSKGV